MCQDLLKKLDVRSAYENALEKLRFVSNSVAHETDFELKVTDDIVAKCITVFAAEFKCFMRKIANSQDLQALPISKGPKTYFRIKADERSAIEALSVVSNLWDCKLPPAESRDGALSHLKRSSGSGNLNAMIEYDAIASLFGSNGAVLNPLSFHSAGSRGCVLQVIDGPRSVFVLGDELPRNQVVLSDGERCVTAHFAKEFRCHPPALYSLVDVRVWKCTGASCVVFSSDESLSWRVADVLEILHCNSVEDVPNPGKVLREPIMVDVFFDDTEPSSKWEEDVELWECDIGDQRMEILGNGDDEAPSEDSYEEDSDDGDIAAVLPKPAMPTKHFPRSLTTAQLDEKFPLFRNTLNYEGKEAYIFHCNKNTFLECQQKKLFGGYRFHSALRPGSILYLFNTSRQEITGPFVAETAMGNHDPAAWGGNFKQQVRIAKSNPFLPVTLPKGDERLTNITGPNFRWSGHKPLDVSTQVAVTELFLSFPESKNAEQLRLRRLMSENFLKSEGERVAKLNAQKEGEYRAKLLAYEKKKRELALAAKSKADKKRLREEQKKLKSQKLKGLCEAFDEYPCAFELEGSVRKRFGSMIPCCQVCNENENEFCPMWTGIHGHHAYSAIENLCRYDQERETRVGYLSVKFETLANLRRILMAIRDGSDSALLTSTFLDLMTSLNKCADDLTTQRMVLACVISFGVFGGPTASNQSAMHRFMKDLNNFIVQTSTSTVNESAMKDKWKKLYRSSMRLKIGPPLGNRAIRKDDSQAPPPDPSRKSSERALLTTTGIDALIDKSSYESDPTDLICLISNELFFDPVSIEGDSTGGVYERKYLEEWLSIKGKHPLTLEPVLQGAKLIPNLEMLEQVRKYKISKAGVSEGAVEDNGGGYGEDRSGAGSDNVREIGNVSTVNQHRALLPQEESIQLATDHVEEHPRTAIVREQMFERCKR